MGFRGLVSNRPSPIRGKGRPVRAPVGALDSRDFGLEHSFPAQGGFEAELSYGIAVPRTASVTLPYPTLSLKNVRQEENGYGESTNGLVFRAAVRF